MIKKTMIFIALIACIIFSLNSALYAQSPNSNYNKPVNTGNSGNSGNSNSSLNIFNVKGIKSGLIKVDKNIFYSTDKLDVSVVFPKSLKSLWNGSADAYLVIRMTDGTLLAPFPILSSGQTPDKPKSFVSIDLSATPIPTGDYQLALILVKPGGDALNLSDWYNGFGALISATTFKFKTQCDPLDINCDGIIDITGVAVSPSSVTPSASGSTTITVSNGEVPYTIVSGDASIASVSDATLPDDGTFIITGVVNGVTTVTVTDFGGNTAVVDVTVTDTTPVTVNPAQASLSVSEITNITITGGVGGYTATSSDNTVASVLVIGDTVKITGNADGLATITISDNNGESVDVSVTVTGTVALTVNPVSASIQVSETTNITISGGTGGYAASSNDDAVATVSVSGDIATIEGKGTGNTTITIMDTGLNSAGVGVTVQ